MRLWAEQLIPYLPRQQLLGQHRECSALRGNGWGKKHSVVDYVWNWKPGKLFAYHLLVMLEMSKRGYKASSEWMNPRYRGKKCDPWTDQDIGEIEISWSLYKIFNGRPIYPEHDPAYLQECLDNLKAKGIEIDMGGVRE